MRSNGNVHLTHILGNNVDDEFEINHNEFIKFTDESNVLELLVNSPMSIVHQRSECLCVLKRSRSYSLCMTDAQQDEKLIFVGIDKMFGSLDPYILYIQFSKLTEIKPCNPDGICDYGATKYRELV